MKVMQSDLQAEHKRIKEESEGLEVQRKRRIATEREIAMLKAQLKFAQTNQSGDKSQKVRKADSKDEPQTVITRKIISMAPWKVCLPVQ